MKLGLLLTNATIQCIKDPTTGKTHPFDSSTMKNFSILSYNDRALPSSVKEVSPFWSLPAFLEFEALLLINRVPNIFNKVLINSISIVLLPELVKEQVHKLFILRHPMDSSFIVYNGEQMSICQKNELSTLLNYQEKIFISQPHATFLSSMGRDPFPPAKQWIQIDYDYSVLFFLFFTNQEAPVAHSALTNPCEQLIASTTMDSFIDSVRYFSSAFDRCLTLNEVIAILSCKSFRGDFYPATTAGTFACYLMCALQILNKHRSTISIQFRDLEQLVSALVGHALDESAFQSFLVETNTFQLEKFYFSLLK
jgi:hypothetical protein